MKHKQLRACMGVAAFAALGFGAQAVAQEHSEELVYNGEVGRIINENCVVCHREGGIGPFAINSHLMLMGWSPMIREV